MTLTAREAYPLWAPTYERETVVSWLEDVTVRRIACNMRGRTLLDVGCGTARRLADHVGVARHTLGVDLVPSMLRAGASDARRRGRLVAGDLRALPLRDAVADVTWCRLTLGHVREIDRAYRELRRVTRASGTVVVSDFHLDAVGAGHRRTFRDGEGRLHEVEHFRRSMGTHESAARAAGLVPVTRTTGRVDECVLPIYQRAGRLGAYHAQRGLALVWVMVLAR